MEQRTKTKHKRYRDIDFAIPSSVAEVARTALEDMQKLAEPLKVALKIDELAEETAHILSEDGEATKEEVETMLRYFDTDRRHGAAHEKADPQSNDGIIWRLWGGNPGRIWAFEIEHDMRLAEDKAKKWVAPWER